MTLYTRKPEVVEVWRWDGFAITDDNCPRWVDDSLVQHVISRGQNYLDVHDVYIYHGDFLVRDVATGDVAGYTARDFYQRYAPNPEATPENGEPEKEGTD